MRCFFTMVMCFVLFVSVPAKAELQNFGPAMFAASLPINWQAEQEAAMYVSFRPMDDSCEVSVLSHELLLADAALWAARRAKIWEREDTLRILPEGQGFIFIRKDGRRCWLDARDGWLLEVAVAETTKDLKALFHGFQAAAEVPGLVRLLAALSGSPIALDWLGSGGAMPGVVVPPAPAPVLPNFTTYGVTEDNMPPPALPENLPVGWVASFKGSWMVVLAEDGKHWGACRDYPIVQEDKGASEGEPLWDTMLAVAALLNGRNFFTSEGAGEVETSAGVAHLNRGENYLRVSIFSDQATLDDIFLVMP